VIKIIGLMAKSIRGKFKNNVKALFNFLIEKLADKK
jgi:hypothetical protein